jgi:uncharacterized membrane protein YbaN (DUF454 family)
MKKILLVTVGSLCLLCGAVGIFLPILPTTPFVLLAAGCFSAYPGVYSRIRRIRFFREYFDAYKEGTPIHTSVRVKSLIALWLTLGLSMFFTAKPILYVILPLVGIAVTIHLFTIGRKRKLHKKTSQQESADGEPGVIESL